MPAKNDSQDISIHTEDQSKHMALSFIRKAMQQTEGPNRAQKEKEAGLSA